MSKRYKKEFDFSYALGTAVVFELMTRRPESARCVYVHPDATKGDALDRLVALCNSRGVQVKYETKIFNVVSQKENCFVIGEFEKSDGTLSSENSHIVLVNPMTGGNVGTVMRTALGFGFSDVALIAPCADSFAPDVVRSSMGAIFSLNVHVFSSFGQYRDAYPLHGLYPFMLDASTPIGEIRFTPPYSLVLGNEAHGLPKEFASYGQCVRIPSTDKIDSFNLSVAAAIGMYEATRRKQQSK